VIFIEREQAMTEQLVKTTSEDGIYTLLLARPDKRNAISDRLLAALEAALVATPEGTRAIILAGEGKHFCAGLDLSEHQHRDAFGTMLHSQSWHRIFARIQNGGIPVIAAMQGAVIGGGLELAKRTPPAVDGGEQAPLADLSGDTPPADAGG